ncbi:unnamed protein product [Boreogadus saida]
MRFFSSLLFCSVFNAFSPPGAFTDNNLFGSKRRLGQSLACKSSFLWKATEYRPIPQGRRRRNETPPPSERILPLMKAMESERPTGRVTYSTPRIEGRAGVVSGTPGVTGKERDAGTLRSEKTKEQYRNEHGDKRRLVNL